MHKVNSLMVDPIKDCVEDSLQNHSLLPTLQYTTHCVGNSQKCVASCAAVPLFRLFR